MSKKANRVRFDLSPYLLHFFRKIDLSGNDAGLYLDEWGPGAIVEDKDITALFLLRNTIRLGRLWSTWSERGGRRTIYGPDPAVCFTDMPIAAFIDAGIARAAKGEAMSPLALVLPKDHVHAAGALPVIYGLCGTYSQPAGLDGGPRIMPNSVLPVTEQFRYVTLGTYGSVDWTHEREWRWPCRGVPERSDDMPPLNGKELPGIDLTFPGMGVIVSTRDQAKKVIHDILVLNDQGHPGDYSFVLVIEDIKSLSDLRYPAQVQQALADAAIEFDQFLDMNEAKIKNLIADYEAVLSTIQIAPNPTYDRAHGGCWLWLTDIMHPLTRALVLDGRVKINREGRYLVELPFDPGFTLARREQMTRQLASKLENKFELASTYHSVIGTFDPDGIPHFSEPPFESNFIYNYGAGT